MIMATDNKNKVLNVPNLRFPEFTEEWKKTKIGDITSKVGSGVTPKGGSAVYKTSGHLFIRSQNVGNGRFLLDDVAYIDEATHKKQINTELKDGDVLLNITGASIGRTTVVNKNVEGGNVNQHVCIIRLLEDYSPNYICNYLLSYGGQKQIDSFQAGGNREGLNFEQIRSIKFFIPSFREQSKIASLLSLLEERIATQNKIIEQLQSLIKGIVVLITAETPNARIDKCLVCHSSTLQENNIEDFGDFPVYGANGICGYTVNADFNEPAILIVKDGSGVGNVRFVNGRYSVIGTQNIFTPQNEICLKYIFYCLQAFNFVPYKTGMAIPHIYFKDYGKAKIYCPNFEQQVKIASQIDLIESKIEIATQLLNKYEEQKKFLLSNMFI